MQLSNSKQWYKYTDESGDCWRIQTTPDLAEIGGLEVADCQVLQPLPDNITPRYVWLQEIPRPQDRLPARQKVIIERGRLKQMLGSDDFDLSGKKLRTRSYFGEVVSLK